jgi:hypothetical protein
MATQSTSERRPSIPRSVGETALDPEERLAKHRAGERSSGWVRVFGVLLVPALSAGLREFETVVESRAAEADLGERLRA